ncbi:helix-turn-helix domain-containing protein [Bradyrhizobium sp. HKCCYLS2038]|uniref:AraC-like ligand-binding domain-containing protein n=1 Tax=unclassified Bradyrhizobium TaxID=2631580 RepID=UPI003EBEB142
MLPEGTTGPSMQPCFASTAGIPARERFDYWHDVVGRNLVDLDYGLVGDSQFDATFHGTPINGLDLCRIKASPHLAQRSPAGISRADSSMLVFNFVLSGSLVAEQDGRSAHLKPGDGALCDARRPYKLHSQEAFELACIRVPREQCAGRIPHLHRLSACNLGQRGELAPMVFGYISHLIERAPNLTSRAAGYKISQNFKDLLLATLAELAESLPPSLTEYRSLALMRVKAMVERNAHDPELTPAAVAAELKLSPRYINQLLEAEGTSLSRYIWSRRLDRCAEQLKDPALRARSVSQIAMDNGFNDLSHFSKAFRSKFGSAPRDYRSDQTMHS